VGRRGERSPISARLCWEPSLSHALTSAPQAKSAARDHSAAVLSVHNFRPADEVGGDLSGCAGTQHLPHSLLALQISKQMRAGVPLAMRREIWLAVSGGLALKESAPERFKHALHGAMRLGACDICVVLSQSRRPLRPFLS
jgi:hypothetical protein